jgi:hypothetical protein
MKWYRAMVVLAFLLVAACTDPVVPKYPEDDTTKKDDDNPDTALVVDAPWSRLA